MDQFWGYHSEWNLGSPGGWDYQRITQEICHTVWDRHFKKYLPDIELDFDHPLLNPVYSFAAMLQRIHQARNGRQAGLIAIVAEAETLDVVIENKNLVSHLNRLDGLSAALMAPQELELKGGQVCWHGQPVSIIFMDFNTNVLLDLHRQHNLTPLLQAVREGRVVNPRGTEPINSKSMFEPITLPQHRNRFQAETIARTPWTRQFYPRRTEGPKGEAIADLVEWTRTNWERLVLKPDRGYSGKGVSVGGVHHDVDEKIDIALKSGDYIVQEKIPLYLWSEVIPEIDPSKQAIMATRYQTDFRCLFGDHELFGFVGRYGQVPTNVGSGGGVHPLAILRSSLSVAEATLRINEAILNMSFDEVADAVALQRQMALDQHFTYLLGPIKIALRPRLITIDQIQALENYCAGIWADCLTLEQMWMAGALDVKMSIEPEELEIITSQPWRGSPAILASDGLFSFGAHIT